MAVPETGRWKSRTRPFVQYEKIMTPPPNQNIYSVADKQLASFVEGQSKSTGIMYLRKPGNVDVDLYICLVS